MKPSLIAPTGRWSLPALALAVVLAGGSAVTLVGHHAGALPTGVAFRVAGHDVTVSELDSRIATLTALYSLKKPTGGSALATFRRDAAKSMAVSMILEDQAKADGIVVSSSEAQAGLDRVIQQDLGGDTTKFTTFLGNAGISQNDVLAEVSRTIATSRLYSKVTRSVKAPTDAQAQADYTAHQADMVSPEERTLSNIVVGSEAAAKQVLARLRSGESFRAVAKATSLDASTRVQGGSLGTHAAADLDSGYAKVAFAAPVHTLFGPVSTGTGTWNVGYVDAVQPSAPLTFAQVKSTLIAALQSRAQLKVWNAWLTRVIRAAAVEYADEYRPANPNSAPAIGASGGTS
jgi:peptidyl-prolyl cis-trans isomerase C